jgi:hypothetical protein
MIVFLVAELRLEANDPDAEEMDSEILDETEDIEDTREWLEADDIEEADDDDEAEEPDEAEDWEDPEEDPDEALRRLDFRSVKEGVPGLCSRRWINGHKNCGRRKNNL